MEQKIIELLTKNKNGLSFSQFKKLLNLMKPGDGYLLNDVLKKLINNNKIFYRRKNELYFLKNEEFAIGTFRTTFHDFAFVEDENGSIFIPGKFVLNALDGDSVKVTLFTNTKEDAANSDKRSGKVVRVLKRNGSNIVGRIKKIENNLEFIPDDIDLKYHYKIVEDISFKEGDVLVVIFKDFVDRIIYVNLKENLGSEKNANLDYLLIKYKNNLKEEFSEQVKKDLKSQDFKLKNLEDRKDFTNNLIVTIDGETSKDLDDAIELEMVEGNYKLSVHIADVSYYVKKDTPLDLEAYERATSVYLIDKVFPMLPKELSDDLCSLNPNEKKLAMTCEMLINSKGDVLDVKVYESIIKSSYRLTYTEVDKLYSNPKVSLRNDKRLSDMLLKAKDLSDILRAKKLKNGMIDFKLKDIKITLDKNGEPTSIKEIVQTPSEAVIEDLMVITNEMIAKKFVDNKLPTLFRVHKSPKTENLESFKSILDLFKLIFNFKDLTSNKFEDFLNKYEANPNIEIIKKILIQAMEKAIYLETNEGHYALGLKNYLHFTSPIRRYPDLIVHRLLKLFFLDKDSNLQISKKDKILEELKEVAKHCSLREREAMVSERKLADIKKVRFLGSKALNRETSGKLVGFSKFGMFVEIENMIQGLIKLDFIKEKFQNFEYNEKQFTLLLNGKKYRLGDDVNIKIVGIDLIRGLVNLELLI